jgi:prepilin-type N-terminal cleavage/methylation domain-containing protein
MRRGFTVVEVVVALVITGLGLLAATFLVEQSQKSSLTAERRGRLNSALGEFEKASVRLSAVVSPPTFDPMTTFRIAANGAFTNLVGRSWYQGSSRVYSVLGAPPAGQPTVPTLSVGLYQRARSSHDLDVYRIDAGGGVAREAVYMSRCVPVSDLPGVSGRYRTLAQIDALDRRPVLTSPSAFRCCRVQSSTAPWQTRRTQPVADCQDHASWLPTVFVYRGEGQVSVMPADSDRDVLPGMGFVLGFRFPTAGPTDPDANFFSTRDPLSASLATVWIQNSCQIGRRGQLWPCQAKPATGVPTNFMAEAESFLSLKPVSIVSSVGGGGYLKLGTGTVREGP